MFVKMRKRAGSMITVLAVILALGMIVPLALSRMDRQGVDRSRVAVASVNGRKITALRFSQEFYKAYQERVRTGDLRHDNLDALRSQVMDYLIERELVLHAASLAGFKAPKDEVDRLYKADRDHFRSELDFESFLGQYGFTLDTYRTYISEQLVYSRFPSVVLGTAEVSDEEIQTELEKSLGRNPSLNVEEAKKQLTDIIKYRKEREAYGPWMAGLKEKAKITVTEPRVLGYRAVVAGNLQEAIDHYKRALKDSPQDPYVHLSLARAYMALNMPSEAQASANRAFELEPRDPYIMMVQAEVAQAMGDADKAAESLRKAGQASMDDIRAHRAVRDAFAALGLTEDVKNQEERISSLLRAMGHN